MDEVSKTLVCLIDGASWNVVKPIVEKNKSLLSSKIFNEGAVGDLDNLGEHQSPIIWTTLATGWRKEDHNITDFTYLGYKKKNSITPVFTNNYPSIIKKGFKKILPYLPFFERLSVNSKMVEKKPIWQILSEMEISVGVINWWCTYPPIEINDGYIVSDHANHMRVKLRKNVGSISVDSEEINKLAKTVSPDSLAEEINQFDENLSEEKIGKIIRNISKLDGQEIEKCLEKEKFSRDDPLSVLKFSILQDLFALECLEEFDEDYDPKCNFIGLGGLDAICHHFWKYRYPEEFENVEEEKIEKYGDMIENYYKFLDEKINEFVNKRNVENIVILSDHGFETVESQSMIDKGISGTHLSPPQGIFMMKGPHVKEIKGIKIKSVDLVPTLLYLFRLPIGEDMPGEPHKRIFKSSYRDSVPVEWTETWEKGHEEIKKSIDKSEAEEEIRDKLQALGYID